MCSSKPNCTKSNLRLRIPARPQSSSSLAPGHSLQGEAGKAPSPADKWRPKQAERNRTELVLEPGLYQDSRTPTLTNFFLITCPQESRSQRSTPAGGLQADPDPTEGSLLCFSPKAVTTKSLRWRFQSCESLSYNLQLYSAPKQIKQNGREDEKKRIYKRKK